MSNTGNVCRRAGAKRALGDIAGAELDEARAAAIKQTLAPSLHATLPSSASQAPSSVMQPSSLTAGAAQSAPPDPPRPPVAASVHATLPLSASQAPSSVIQPSGLKAGAAQSAPHKPPSPPVAASLHATLPSSAPQAPISIDHSLSAQARPCTSESALPVAAPTLAAASPALADAPLAPSLNAAAPAAEPAITADETPASRDTANDVRTRSIIDSAERAAVTPLADPSNAELTAWESSLPLAEAAKENSSLLANSPDQQQLHGPSLDGSTDVLCVPGTPDLPAEPSPQQRIRNTGKRRVNSNGQLKHDSPASEQVMPVSPVYDPAHGNSPAQHSEAPAPAGQTSENPMATSEVKHDDSRPPGYIAAPANSAQHPSDGQTDGGESQPLPDAPADGRLMQDKAAR